MQLEKIKQLKEIGYTVTPSLIDTKLCTEILDRIDNSIADFADEVGCSTEQYLMAVSAWGRNNKLVKGIVGEIIHIAMGSANAIIGDEVELLEAKLLMKGKYCPWPTHAHQDVSYRWKDGRKQYHFSSWISLTNIGLEQAPLEFLPKSHLEDISEYQDYLDPEFRDRRDSDEWKRLCQTTEMNKGDAVIFDSRIWHASAEWSTPPSRYALVLRWHVPGRPDVKVPDPTGDVRWMYDFSNWLENSLNILLGEDNIVGDCPIERAIESNLISSQLKKFLNRFLVNRNAGKLHGGTAQRGMLYDPLAEVVREELAELSLTQKFSDLKYGNL
tara:strand:- start:952 stop:1935 length:984 start_codon:yes stop_codon:yes gene_type:complete